MFIEIVNHNFEISELHKERRYEPSGDTVEVTVMGFYFNGKKFQEATSWINGGPAKVYRGIAATKTEADRVVAALKEVGVDATSYECEFDRDEECW